jgi:hypothetical protein
MEWCRWFLPQAPRALQPSKRRQVNSDPALTAPLPLSSSVLRIQNTVLLFLKNPFTFKSTSWSRWRAHPAKRQGYSGLVARNSFPNVLHEAPQPPPHLSPRSNDEHFQILLGRLLQNHFSTVSELVVHTMRDPPAISPTAKRSPRTPLCDSCHNRQHGSSSAWESLIVS